MEKRGGGEQRKIDEQHLEPALVEAADHGRQQQRRHDDHQRIAQVGREVVDGLDLDAPRHVRLEHHGQHLDAGLDEPLGPARLLRLEGGHLDGQLGRALDLGQVFELPAGQLRAVAQVGVFGERVVLPAAAVGDGLDAPHAGGAVEVEVVAGAGAGAVLEHKVAVEQDRLDLGQHAVVAVEVGPARLHHADLRLGKVVDHLHQPVRRRHKVGVEDGDELALGHLQARVQRPGLVSMAVGAVNVDDGMAQRRIARHNACGHLLGLVGRVVQHLDLELVARILHGADRLDQPVDDELLVEDGQLHGDPRQLVEVPGRVGTDSSCGICNRDTPWCSGECRRWPERSSPRSRAAAAPRRRVPVVEALEGLVGVLHRLQVVAQAVLGRKSQMRGDPHRQPVKQAGGRIQTGHKRGEQGRASTAGITAIVCDGMGAVVRSALSAAYSVYEASRTPGLVWIEVACIVAGDQTDH